MQSRIDSLCPCGTLSTTSCGLLGAVETTPIGSRPLTDPRKGADAQHVYRRIHPYHWDSRKNRLKRGAFVPRSGTQLSVFRADLQTPRGLLQHCLNDWQQKLRSPDERAQQAAGENLRKYGDTVEKLVENGWRIAVLPVTAFTDRGFQLDGPEPDGHQNVTGDYGLYSRDLVSIAEVLSNEECLA